MTKIISLYSLLCMLFCGTLSAQDLYLSDPEFGKHGLVKTAISKKAKAYALLLQRDQKIVAAGTSDDGSFTLARYDASGQLDPTFNQNGIQVSQFYNKGAAFALAQQADDKIIAAGFVHTESGDDFALMRYLPNGNIDLGFGAKGRVTTNFHFFDGINDIAIQADGKIVVAGSAVLGNIHAIALARYHTNGSLDESFGDQGKLTTSLTPNGSGAHSLALQKDGKIVLTGFALDGTDFNFALLRYLSEGKLDENFGQNGAVISDFNASTDAAYSLALQKDEKIVLGGISNNDFAFARYLPTGDLDTKFGMDGFSTIDFGGQEGVNAIALQEDGKILAVGYSLKENTEEMTSANFSVARIHSNGVLDQQFTHDLGGAEVANALAIQKDGKVVVAGFSSDGSQSEFALTRYLPALTNATDHIPPDDLAVSIYPNPIKETTTLDYTLTSDSEVSIQLYDLQGKYLCTLLQASKQNAGHHQQVLTLGEEFPGGTYSIVMETELGSTSLRAVKVK